MEDYEKAYEEHWKHLVEQDGSLNLDQVKRELYDYHCVLEEVSTVYMDITNGKFSKPNTGAQHIIDEVNRQIEEAEANGRSAGADH